MRLLALTPIGAERFASELPASLAELFTLEVVEFPGTGDAKPVESPTVASMAAFAAGLVDHDTVLFGHSMNAALVLATAAVTHCRGVIAVAPPTKLPPEGDVITAYWEAKAEPERKQRAAAIRAEFDGASDAEKPMLYVRYNNLRYFYDLDYPLPTPEDWTVAAAWSQQVMASGAEVDWPATFDAVRAPVFLGLGEYDFMCPPTPWLDSRRPGWTVELFARAGHSPFVESADDFVAAVARWAQQL